MTSTAPEEFTTTQGHSSARVAELFGEHGAAELPFVPWVVASEGPVSVIEYRPSTFGAIVEAWRYRTVGFAVFRNAFLRFQSRNRLPGPTWMFIQQFMSMVGFALIFGGGVFNVKTPGAMPYILYSMVGMMGFQLFMHTMYMSMRGFRQVKLVQDIPLPLLWVPIIGSAAGLLRSALSMIWYVVFLLYFWGASGKLYLQLSPRLLAISALGLGLCLMFAWGLGMWLSPLMAWANDTRYVIRLLLPFWMFMTPVLYPIDRLHGTMRLVGQLNPLTGPIEMTKVGLLGAGSVHLLSWLTSFPLIFAIFLSGVWFITRFGHRLASLRTDDDTDDDDLQDGML
jgi:lipopolysaccharide transport system permease protein